MIKSKARCLILDPNGDFRKINKIDTSLWSNNSNKTLKNYDSKSGKGKFQHIQNHMTSFEKQFYNTYNNCHCHILYIAAG